MTKLLLTSVAAVFLLAGPAMAENPNLPTMPIEQAGPADMILMNGQVKTPDGWAQAVAIRGEVIAAVGSDEDMAGLKGKKTKTVDLKGQTVLPGLHDLHVHPVYGGVQQMMCLIPQGATMAELLAIVEDCTQNSKFPGWVFGGQWDIPALGEQPSRAQLDAIAPDMPVFLIDTSGHSGWVNSKALEIAGITKDTPNPEGGIIERDENGEPTGLLHELATWAVRKHIPDPTLDAIEQALKWSGDLMLSYGITAFTEASLGFTSGVEPEMKVYQHLAQTGGLKQRISVCVPWDDDNIIERRLEFSTDRLHVDCVKIFNDGVPTDSHTAAMVEPYADAVHGRDDHASKYGMLLIPQEKLDDIVTKFDAMGMTVKFHAAGDMAVRAGLNAIEAARKANGFSPLMHNVGHCTFVHPEDINRAGGIMATYEVSPYLWAPSPINDSITAAVGAPRIDRVWPVREMIDSGALVVPGSDWAVVPSVNPWIGMETLVTRQVTEGEDPRYFGKGEAITIEEAVDMYTVNSAKQRGMIDKTGRILPGMLADIIVLDQNPLKVDAKKIHETEVQMTLINGEVVYKR